VECWRKEALPARLRFGTHRRVPPVVCMADTGWTLNSSARERSYPVGGGAHGYDPEDPLMGALFVAHGPAFKRGVVVPAFDNVHVYPQLADLLGVKPEASDGDLAVLAPARR